MITDSCPECEPDHLDIQALTFNKMAPMALGRINIQYRRRAQSLSYVILVPMLLHQYNPEGCKSIPVWAAVYFCAAGLTRE